MDEKPQVPPAIMLRQLAFVMRASRALYAAAELNLADILVAGPMTSGEIAARAEVDPPTMRRLMRALVAHGVFEEPKFAGLAPGNSTVDRRNGGERPFAIAASTV